MRDPNIPPAPQWFKDIYDRNNKMMLNQVGEFFISDELLHEHLEIVQKIMGEVVIVSCIHNYAYGRFEYHAFSNHFRAVERGMVAPLYAAIIGYQSNEFISFEEVPR